MGKRELVGLLLFALAAFVGLTVVVPGEGDPPAKRPISLGAPTATPTALATPTPTPVPAVALRQPDQWVIRFLRGRRADAAEDSVTATSTLSIQYNAAPFPDVRDNDWRLRAEATMPLQPGHYTFTIEHDANVTVTIDGAIAATGPDGARRDLVVTFDHTTAKPIAIVIDAIDEEGPFLLRWK